MNSRKIETCKIFDNADFGYRRITVERPLRLRFQVTLEAKEQFLDGCPEFLDAVQAMAQELDGDAYEDWNEAWAECQRIAREHETRWTGANRKLFRQCFTTVDPEAMPVVGRHITATPVISPGHMPGQAFTRDLTPTDLDAVFGVQAEGRGRKARAVEYESDPALRDFENVPLKEDIVSFFLREVRPFVADAWIDRETVDEKDGRPRDDCAGL